jgi:hypothetical protein
MVRIGRGRPFAAVFVDGMRDDAGGRTATRRTLDGIL